MDGKRYACPVCGVGEGVPVEVSLDSRRATLKLRCPECGHEWTLEAGSPTAPQT